MQVPTRLVVRAEALFFARSWAHHPSHRLSGLQPLLHPRSMETLGRDVLLRVLGHVACRDILALACTCRELARMMRVRTPSSFLAALRAHADSAIGPCCMA